MYVGEAMGNVTIALSDQDEAILRRLAKERFNGGKGSMAKAVADGLSRLEAESEREQARQRFLARLKKGYHLGGMTIKSRDEIYDRYDRSKK